MEENSDTHMETDVTSTTDDAVDTQEVTGSSGQVEMIITVEKVDEEEPTSNMPTDGQMEMKTPEKKQGISIKSPSLFETFKDTPAKTDTIQKVTVISPATTQMSSPDNKAKNANFSTKTATLVSPSKDRNKSNDKSSDFYKNMVTQSTSPTTINKSPVKDLKTEKTPVNDTAPVYAHLLEVKDKPTEKNPAMESSEVRTYQIIQRSPTIIRSRPIKLVRSQIIKDFKTQEKEIKSNDTSITPTKVSDTPVNKENIDDKSKNSQDLAQPSISKDVTSETATMNGETSPEESHKVVPSDTEKPVTSASVDIPMDVLDAETSDDSQQSSTSTLYSEKEHNRSISRELKSLINSAKESKIISECTQLTSKTRKSRINQDTSLNTSVETESIQDVRKDPLASDADKPSLKRSMRSQNPDFVTKCKQFLNSVTSKVMKDSDETQSDSETEENKQTQKPEPRIQQSDSAQTTPKKKKTEEPVSVAEERRLRSDPFCWRCHWQLEAESNEKPSVHPPMHCTVCVRSYHSKCMTVVERKTSSELNWVCPDCLQILHAESSESRSPAMKKISLGMLCDLLKYGLERMEAVNGVEPFLKPVDPKEFPHYDKIVVHPMDLSKIRQNIVDGHYGSTEAFIADVQWILHNSILFNASQSKLTQAARALVRTCKAEMTEIETCPECYAGAYSRNLTYFTDVCSTPHMILWAKLKGFPYWPAKAVAVNNGMVDVRFFGQHDKSWVPERDCYLYSEKDPNTNKSKKLELMQCRQEAELHIRNICRKYGSFVYAPFKTTFDHTKMTEQLKMMIPSFKGEIKVTDKETVPVVNDTRSTSKGSLNDDDTNECDEVCTTPSQKVLLTHEDESMLSVSQETSEASCTTPSTSKNGTEEESIPPAAKTLEELKDKPVTVASTSEKDKEMESDESLLSTKEAETPSRKRRRSTYPDPTVLESTSAKKKKKKPVPGPSKKEVKKETVQANKTKTESSKITKTEKNKETQNTETDSREKDKTRHPDPPLKEKEDTKKVTPIKLIALPRVDNQTPKFFATTKVTKSRSSTPTTPSTPNTPAVEEELQTSASPLSSSSSSKRSKVTKADKSNINMSGDKFKARTSRRNSKTNKSLTSTPKDKNQNKSLDKIVDKSVDKKPDIVGKASTSKEKPTKKKDTDKKPVKTVQTTIIIKGEKELGKRSDDDVSLAIIRDSINSSTGLPCISNVVSLSTSAQATSSTTTITTTNTKNTTPKTKPTPSTSKSIEITVEAHPNSCIFTPTSSGNVGTMQEALTKLKRLRNETTTTETIVGRVGVKAFARMTSPVNDEIEVKTEPIDLDEEDEERQLEKMDLMNACRLQPVNQIQNLRDVRINKVIVNPVVVKKNEKPTETRSKAKKSFPQPKKPEAGSELNGKNSMVYIPIPQPKAPKNPGTPIPAGPRPSAPAVSTSIVNTVTSPLRPTSTLTIPSLLGSPTLTSSANASTITLATSNSGSVSNIGQVSNLSQVPNIVQASSINQGPTFGPTTVHTVPLVKSVNGQWMFSLQPVMSVGRIDDTPPPTTVNGLTERTGTTFATSSANTMAPPVTPVLNRNQSNVGSPSSTDNATPEMPRLLQRPLMNPFDANTPIGSLPPPSTAGPLTAKLNQNAVKLTDFFRTLLEDSIEKIDEPLAQVTSLKSQLEQARWRHQQNLDEIKHNHELTLSEMRQSFEKEKLRIISETRRAAQVELEAAVKLTKSKQWCSNCHQEAQFYCCWNTSYCDYSCQRAHWNTHFSNCTQEQSFRQLLQQSQKDMLPTPANVPDNNGNTVTTVTSVTSISSVISVTSVTRGSSLTPVTSVTTQKIAVSHARQAEPSRSPPSILRDILGCTIPRDDGNEQRHMLPPILSREVPPSLKRYPPMEEAIKKRSLLNKLNQSTQVELDDSGKDSRSQPMFVMRPDLLAGEHMKQVINNYKEKLAEQTSSTADKGSSESRLQNSDHPPKSVPAQTPCLTTVGGKPAPMRVFTDPSGTQKTSIIVSMVDDPSGAQKVKCVGTYKAATVTKSPSLLTNKQKPDDSGAKKNLTSGGYLIVGGASGSNTSVITPGPAARRSHVQYLS